MVEDDKIDFNGIQMSDFVYPAYHYFGRFLAARDSHMWNDPAVKGPLQSDPYRSGAPICPAFSCRPMARWPR